MSMLAAAIVNVLADAGVSEDATRCWFAAHRRELGGLSPNQALSFEGFGQRVLDLAQADIAAGFAADQYAAALEQAAGGNG